MRTYGFTLLETLIVISILVFLLALLTGVFFNQRRQAKLKQARALIYNIELGLQMYDSAFREYPPGTETDEGALYRYLGRTLVDSRNGKSLRAVPNFTTDQLVEYTDPVYGKSLRVVDPWGNALSYTADRTQMRDKRTSYEISSAGPNGVAGDDDDLLNGER